MLDDIREYVVRPALARLGFSAVNREQLVVGTGLVESGYRFLDQTTPGIGPAYGFWQMEHLTHDDLWATYLAFQPSALRQTLLDVAGTRYQPQVTVLHWNLQYAAAMCALRYRRVREALPVEGDYAGMAAYWKQHYNTPLGKGTIEKASPLFRQVTQL